MRVRKLNLSPEQLKAMRQIFDWLIDKKPQTVKQIAAKLHIDATLVEASVTQHKAIKANTEGKATRYYTTAIRLGF